MPQRGFDRRAFLKSGAVGAVGFGASAQAFAASTAEAADGVPEPARRTPLAGEFDVVICGAGPAGIAAAVAAARAGAKTCLLEVNGCLGGIWTAGLLSWIIDARNKTGIMQEIIQGLQQRSGLADYARSYGYDVEAMKLLLDDLCTAAGVQVQLHTRVVAAVSDKGKRLTHVITESKTGREAWAAQIFVDASGDGDLAAQAGCGFDYGSPDAGLLQPQSMLALLTGLQFDKVAQFVTGTRESRKSPTAKEQLYAEMQRAGVTPSYAAPTLFYLHKDLYCLMANHEYGVSAASAAQISQATIRGRREVNRLVDALRRLGDPWQNVQLVATAEHIGVREGRRIHGLYTITTDDLVQGKQHADAVCRATFGVDIHSPNPQETKGIKPTKIRAKPYDIPYRALIARDVGGLLMAGRCISGDFTAHSSYRVTGNAAAMGEAAGAAAAWATKTKQLPQDVPWPEIRAVLNRKT